MNHTLTLTAAEYDRIVDDLAEQGQAVYGIGGVDYKFGYTTLMSTTFGYKSHPLSFGLLCNEKTLAGTHGNGGVFSFTVEVQS